MWALKPAFKLYLSCQRWQFWPFMGIAAALHLGLIYGYACWLSVQKGIVIAEGVPIELVFLPTPELEKQEVLPVSATPSPLKEKTSILKTASIAKKSVPKEKSFSSESASFPLLTPSLALKRGNPHPPYPDEARAEGWEANVTALITVQPDGNITDVQIISDSPRCFVESVLKTVKQWCYYPHSYPVAYQHQVSFAFRLE